MGLFILGSMIVIGLGAFLLLIDARSDPDAVPGPQRTQPSSRTPDTYR